MSLSLLPRLGINHTGRAPPKHVGFDNELLVKTSRYLFLNKTNILCLYKNLIFYVVMLSKAMSVYDIEII